VICTRSDYYTIPPLEELAQYQDPNGDCFVENLTIGREGYGSVFFPGETNVSNLDIDTIGESASSTCLLLEHHVIFRIPATSPKRRNEVSHPHEAL